MFYKKKVQTTKILLIKITFPLAVHFENEMHRYDVGKHHTFNEYFCIQLFVSIDICLCNINSILVLNRLEKSPRCFMLLLYVIGEMNE